MEMSLQRLPTERRIFTASCQSGRVLDISHSPGHGKIISVSKWEHGETVEEEFGSIATWDKFRNEEFGSCAALDVRNETVFASLSDRRRLAMFPVTSGEKLESTAVFPLNFANPLFALQALPSHSSNEVGDVIFAISSTGELEAFCTAILGRAKRRCMRKTFKPLLLDSVLFVSCFKDDHLIVVGMRDGEIVVLPSKFSMKSSFTELDLDMLPAIQLPQPPSSVVSSKTVGDSFVLGFLMTESYCFILYSGGFVHIFTSNSLRLEKRRGTLVSWYDGKNGQSDDKHVSIAEPSHAFRLSPGTAKDNSVVIADIWKDVKDDAGDVADLGGGYVAIGYGQYVSIWDGIYKVGHAIQQITGRVTAICSQAESAKAVIATEEGFMQLHIEDPSPVSLGLAVRRKGSCDAIVTRMLQSADQVPVHSQPVTVGVTKVAAEAGSTERVFGRLLKSLDDEEMKIVRALVNREVCHSPEAVAKLTQRYTTEYKKVRRGNRGKSTDLGLSNLPSERLAAVSVARCLYEIHFGHARYVVPLIDMIGTGVVSCEAVLPVVEMSDSWQMGSEGETLVLRSIVDPLITSPTFLNALEAIVRRVADLPEADIVRIVQFAVRMIQASSPSSDDEEAMTDGSESTASLLRSRHFAQASNLLFSCVNASVDKRRVVEALRQVPLADVVRILGRFDHMLSAASFLSDLHGLKKLPEVPLSVKRGFFGTAASNFDVTLYRGVGNWLDHENMGTMGAESDFLDSGGFIQWSCHLIDAHLATLVMDKSGRELTTRLLQTVRRRKREFEVLKSLQGLTSHLLGNHPIPSSRDPLYSNTTIEVPAYAALK